MCNRTIGRSELVRLALFAISRTRLHQSKMKHPPSLPSPQFFLLPLCLPCPPEPTNKSFGGACLMEEAATSFASQPLVGGIQERISAPPRSGRGTRTTLNRAAYARPSVGGAASGLRTGTPPAVGGGGASSSGSGHGSSSSSRRQRQRQQGGAHNVGLRWIDRRWFNSGAHAVAAADWDGDDAHSRLSRHLAHAFPLCHAGRAARLHGRAAAQAAQITHDPVPPGRRGAQQHRPTRGEGALPGAADGVPGAERPRKATAVQPRAPAAAPARVVARVGGSTDADRGQEQRTHGRG